jgi:hypothetical protein
MNYPADRLSSEPSFQDPFSAMPDVSAMDNERQLSSGRKSSWLESIGRWTNVIALMAILGTGIGYACLCCSQSKTDGSHRKRINGPLDVMMWLSGSEMNMEDVRRQLQSNSSDWQRQLERQNDSIRQQFLEASRALK